jgi:L-threonylcarbamoyladenylate synthase
MTEFIHLDGLSPSGTMRLADVDTVADTLRGGGLAVLPTETGYMLAAVATDEAAVERAFAAKRRSTANPMHVACSSVSMAARYARLSADAVRVMGALTPGPVTVVAAKTALLPDRLVTLNGTVGIRVPDHPATLQVIAEVGVPLTASSVNESGKAYQAPDRATLAALAWPADRRVCVVDAGDATRYSMPSTLVRVTGGAIEILRQGPIDETAIKAALHR